MNPLEILLSLASLIEMGLATPAQEAIYLAVVTLLGIAAVAFGFSLVVGIRCLVHLWATGS